MTTTYCPECGADHSGPCRVLIDLDPQGCQHSEIVPCEEQPEWGRCTQCGDTTFPLSARTAGLPESEDEETIRDLRAQLAQAQDQLREQTEGLVCACGCSWDEHEVIDANGYACEHDDHECIQCWPSVLAILQRLRGEVAKVTTERDEATGALDDCLPWLSRVNPPPDIEHRFDLLMKDARRIVDAWREALKKGDGDAD